MSDKDQSIEAILEEFSKHFSTPRSTAFMQRTCVICGGGATLFNDAISEREYKISGMCQKCQDEHFEKEMDWDDED